MCGNVNLVFGQSIQFFWIVVQRRKYFFQNVLFFLQYVIQKNSDYSVRYVNIENYSRRRYIFENTLKIQPFYQKKIVFLKVSVSFFYNLFIIKNYL